MDEWLKREMQIVLVETLAAVLALETFGPLVPHGMVMLMVDAQATEGALIKGYSARSDLCSTVGAFWASALRHNLTIYVDRVSTDANPADGPSRGDFAAADELGWVRVEPNWGSLMRMHVRPGTGNSS